jgi:hypothetical protein
VGSTELCQKQQKHTTAGIRQWSTSPPVRCLNRAERTGSLVLSYSIVTNTLKHTIFGFVFSVNRYLAIIATANYAACRRRSIQGKEAKHSGYHWLAELVGAARHRLG